MSTNVRGVSIGSDEVRVGPTMSIFLTECDQGGLFPPYVDCVRPSQTRFVCAQPISTLSDYGPPRSSVFCTVRQCASMLYQVPTCPKMSVQARPFRTGSYVSEQSRLCSTKHDRQRPISAVCDHGPLGSKVGDQGQLCESLAEIALPRLI